MNRSDSKPGALSGLEKIPGNSSNKSADQLNADLAAENLKLRTLAERRSAALSHLAHELRTPLTSILGFAEILLSQEELSDAQRNFCERIQKSAHQLRDGLNQLSEVSRMEGPPNDQST